MHFFFHAKITKCVGSLWFFFLLLCWYLALFFFSNQLIIIVLCSLDSKQFPEIKKEKKNQLLLPKHGGWCTAVFCQPIAAHAENDPDRPKPSTARAIGRVALAHPFVMKLMSSFIVLKVVAFPFK